MISRSPDLRAMFEINLREILCSQTDRAGKDGKNKKYETDCFHLMIELKLKNSLQGSDLFFLKKGQIVYAYAC